mgnify:CR=1 FL=1
MPVARQIAQRRAFRPVEQKRVTMGGAQPRYKARGPKGAVPMLCRAFATAFARLKQFERSRAALCVAHAPNMGVTVCLKWGGRTQRPEREKGGRSKHDGTIERMRQRERVNFSLRFVYVLFTFEPCKPMIPPSLLTSRFTPNPAKFSRAGCAAICARLMSPALRRWCPRVGCAWM